MTKVRDLPYERYTLEAAQRAYSEFEAAATRAKSVDEVIEAREKYKTELRHFVTANALAYCRFTLNTKDEFYKGEMDYYDEVGPEFSAIGIKVADLMLSSPYRSELEARLNPRVYKEYEMSKKAFSPAIIEESKKENALVTEYAKLMSEMKFEYRGEVMPLSMLRGHLSDSDREVRRETAEAIGRGLSENSAELDRIFDELVKVRTEMARKMGYKDYVELGYYRMQRIDYDKEMVRSFRENVAKDLVPVISDIKRAVAKEMGWERVMFYDNDTYIKGEAPNPVLDADGIFREALSMYQDMSPETGSFMKSMLDAEAFDVESRDGKWGGGYCTAFADFKQPFILANFNGTSDDIDVITHEFGHALADHFMFTEGDEEVGVGGMETAECHSMSMEFFAYPYMQAFCGDRAEVYKLKHMLDSLSFIPYGVIVDEFQHIVYENPDYTPEERNAAYRALEEKYRPYMSYEGIEYLELGTRWQYQMHIYERPFYYIDYCLAQTVALGFFIKSLSDYGKAFSEYLNFARCGGRKPFAELVRGAGLKSPFEEGALAELATRIKAAESDIRRAVL